MKPFPNEYNNDQKGQWECSYLSVLLFFLIIMTIEAGWYKIEWTKLTNKNTRVLWLLWVELRWSKDNFSVLWPWKSDPVCYLFISWPQREIQTVITPISSTAFQMSYFLSFFCFLFFFFLSFLYCTGDGAFGGQLVVSVQTELRCSLLGLKNKK